jgi:hypothetical protein
VLVPELKMAGNFLLSKCGRPEEEEGARAIHLLTRQKKAASVDDVYEGEKAVVVEEATAAGSD